MTCNDVMTRNPSCCVAHDSVAYAAQLMKTENVGSVPVVSDHQTRKLVGIVTDRDLALHVVAERKDAGSTSVSDVMSTDLVTVAPGDNYDDVLEAMAEHQIRRVPVVDSDQKLMGIISQADVARTSDEPEAVGELVSNISEPSDEDVASRGAWTKGMMVAAGLGLGAGLLYLLPLRASRMHD